MKSSSFINLNGDLKQNKFKIIIYLLINLFQNIYYSLWPKKFLFIKFKPKIKKYIFKNHQSISRKLCGVFWKNMNWKIVAKHIGKFNIFEIGSGDGNYFKKDIAINQKYIEKYNGYDVVDFKNWKKIKNKKFTFKKFDGYSFESIITKKHNLFISQSCLEHMKYDLSFFEKIKIKSYKTKKKIILLNCLPNFFCLFTYLTHGYRQYNSENLNKISKILGEDNFFVIKLGNLELNFEHLIKTTIPLILKKKDFMKYQKKYYYKRINNLIKKNQTRNLYTSSFIVSLGFINFEKMEKEEIIKKLFA